MKLKRFLAVLFIVFCFSLLLLPTVYADEDTTENSEDATAETYWEIPVTVEPTESTEPLETVPEETQPEAETIEDTQPTYRGDIIYEPPTIEEETQPATFYPIEEEKPTNPRVTGSEDNSGNLVIAAILWGSIIAGVIIVISIVVATHRRKTM